jgi:hypothetical protein
MTRQLARRSTTTKTTEGRGRGPRGHLTPLPRASRCPIPGCLSQIDPTRLMCRDHWYLVPKQIRDRVWATWQSGQRAFSPEHKEAVRKAIAACQVAVASMSQARTAGEKAAVAPDVAVPDMS